LPKSFSPRRGPDLRDSAELPARAGYKNAVTQHRAKTAQKRPYNECELDSPLYRNHRFRTSGYGIADAPQGLTIPRVVGMAAKDAIDTLRWTKLRIVQLWASDA
jgi:hypothetical protein